MAPQTIISTIRHATTEYNAQRRYAGTLDVPLSERGVQEAREAAARLAGMGYDVVITSSLQRAWQTARIVAADKVPIVRSKLCRERCFGVMEGLTWDQVQDLDPPVLMIKVGNDLHTVNPKGGEPFEQVWDRARAFRRYLFKKHLGKHVLVISHGVFLQLFHGLLRGFSCIESLGTYPHNLELSRFRFSGQRLVDDKVQSVRKADPQRW
jgi:broad specificity phosphatase PhoE